MLLQLTTRKHDLQVDLEKKGQDIDFQQLQGLWKLIYTTALDVVRLDLCMEGMHIVGCIVHATGGDSALTEH